MTQPNDLAAKHPNAAQLLQQGLLHHRQGEIALAMQRYNEVLGSEPRNADALYYVAVIACQEGRFRQGIDLARRALESGPPQARVHNLLGKALEREGSPIEALQHFEQAVALDQNFAEAHGNRANLLAATGRTEDALKAFERVLTLDPNSATDWANHGALLQQLGRHESALASYDKALALGLAPDDIAVLTNRANALVNLGRHKEALESFNKALTLMPGDINLLMARAHVLARLARYAEAEADFDSAIEREPKRQQTYLQKGQLLRDRWRYAEALACFEQALSIGPEDADTLLTKGQLLQNLGRIDEARAVTEKAIELDPSKTGGHMEFARMSRFVPGDPRLAPMQGLLPNIDRLPDMDQVHLHFALAKAHEDLGEHEQAFEHLVQGNAAQRRRQQNNHYDLNVLLDRFDRTARVFTPELFRIKSGSGNVSDQPIFIVGMPRSGSSLVEQILASHPGVYGAGERTDFLEATLSVTGNAAFPDCVPTITHAQLSELGAMYLSTVTQTIPSTDRFTDKLPVNFLVVGLIHLALPNARIIHIRRDPIDTCLSCFSTLFSSALEFTYDLRELGRYYGAYARLMEHWRRVLPQGVMLEVQYEDLVENIEAQTRRMLDFCGLDWDDACLAFHKTERPVLTASLVQVRQPLYRNSIGRWRPYRKQLQPLFEALGIKPDER
ncbi:MAG TPA: tetratricopeptide repeat protein [Pseudolabrys sp.]|nr:tetratricopeptide repeat protein [Pseudolabrys sp.]